MDVLGLEMDMLRLEMDVLWLEVDVLVNMDVLGLEMEVLGPELKMQPVKMYSDNSYCLISCLWGSNNTHALMTHKYQ